MSHKHECPHCGADHTKFFDRLLEIFNRPTNVAQPRTGSGRCGACNGPLAYHIVDLERTILRKDEEILRLEREIVVGLSAIGFRLEQIDQPRAGIGASDMIDPTKNGVAVGTTGWFQYSTLPIGGKLKPGAPVSITSGDKSITFGIGVSPDGDPTKFSAAVDAAETLASFGVTIAGTSLDGSAIQSTFSVPVLPAGSTGGTLATGFDLVQLASAPVAPGGGGTSPDTSIAASPSSLALSLSSAPTAKLSVAGQPSGADVTASSTYTVDNPAVATVAADGTVTAISAGSFNVAVANGSLTTSVPGTVSA